MTNVTNGSTDCAFTDMEDVLTSYLYVASYEVFLPFYFVIGICGHGVCVFAFCKQCKKGKEQAYVYQVIASIGDIAEVIVVTLCQGMLCNLAGLRLPGESWFRKNYVLMWFSAHVTVVLEHTFVTTTLLLYVCTAADRAYAMANPFKHKTIDHKKYQILACVASFSIGLLTTIFDGFRFQVRLNGDLYEIYTDQAFVNSSLAFALALLRNAVRVVANVALTSCNIAMVIYYRSNFRKVGSTKVNQQRTAREKATQKLLLLLTLCQSLFTTVDMTLYDVYYTELYGVPGFSACGAELMSVICDMTLQVAGVLELFSLFAISKQLRQCVRNAVRCDGVLKRKRTRSG